MSYRDKTKKELIEELKKTHRRIKELEEFKNNHIANSVKKDKGFEDLYHMVRLMCDNVPDMIWAKDRDKKFLFTNQAIIKKLLNAKNTKEPLGKTDMFFAERERSLHPENPDWHTFGEICRDSDEIVLKTQKPERFDEFGNVKGKFLYLDVNKAPFRNEEGDIIGTVGCARDVTREKHIEEALIESEELFHSLLDTMLDPIIIIDFKGKILFANNAAFTMAGLEPKDDYSIFNIKDFVMEEFLKDVEDHQRMVKEGRGGFIGAYKIKNKSGEIRWVEGLGTNIKFKGQKANLVDLRDITDRKKAEEDLIKSLKEKEILLREVHHRVKNNMQIISSLLNLQSQYVHEPKTRDILMDSQGRIKSMSMVHEELYHSPDLSSIKFKEYVEKLVSNIFFSNGVNMNLIHLIINIEEQEIDMDTALPLGLIINEIVTNSIKYAFPGEERGEISIELKSGDQESVLTLADDGIGLPLNIKLDNTNTLGLQMVNNLIKQLDGNLKLDRTNGTKYEITFHEL